MAVFAGGGVVGVDVTVCTVSQVWRLRRHCGCTYIHTYCSREVGVLGEYLATGETAPFRTSTDRVPTQTGKRVWLLTPAAREWSVDRNQCVDWDTDLRHRPVAKDMCGGPHVNFSRRRKGSQIGNGCSYCTPNDAALRR